MNKNLKIAIAQINPTVGDFAGNKEKIENLYSEAVNANVELIIFSELAICGYPLEDMPLMPAFVEQALIALEEITNLTKTSETSILIGALSKKDNKIYNSAFLLSAGKVVHEHHKVKLPNYGVFDEKRVYAQGDKYATCLFKGVKLGVLICEDIWFEDGLDALVKDEVELVISINASPFERDKHFKRLAVVKNHSTKYNLPIIYVNQIGGQDGLVFDGGSFILDARGDTYAQLPSFKEKLEILDINIGKSWKNVGIKEFKTSSHEQVYNALILGLRDYMRKNGFTKIVLGLSGGIDSAISAAIAADAVGAENVVTVALPSMYTSETSIIDAEDSAKRIGCKYQIIPIKDTHAVLLNTLEPYFDGKEPDITEENIQARIRGIILMALSNKHGYMLLSTGNKSEIAVGYATLYGDMCGSYNVLKDLYKTEVYELSNWRNNHIPDLSLNRILKVIPENIITKVPTAELRFNQTDQDSLPPYDLLDEILFNLIEKRMSSKELINLGYDKKIVEKVTKLLYRAEFKRRQSAPGVKVSPMSFGLDRRFPITNKFID
jgi:NAD+ synthase